ncbi:hypothetical protein ABVT39_022035 [Epinephelus coioides]
MAGTAVLQGPTDHLSGRPSLSVRLPNVSGGQQHLTAGLLNDKAGRSDHRATPDVASEISNVASATLTLCACIAVSQARIAEWQTMNQEPVVASPKHRGRTSSRRPSAQMVCSGRFFTP